VEYWIQNSDFSNPEGLSENEPVQSAKQIVAILREYDWARENAYEEKRLMEDGDCCPAGIGIMAEDGHIFHICPKAKLGKAIVYFHHQVPAKIFGFINFSKSQITTYEDVPLTKLESAIKKFLANEYDAITGYFQGYIP
jgi:hypothetical protein